MPNLTKRQDIENNITRDTVKSFSKSSLSNHMNNYVSSQNIIGSDEENSGNSFDMFNFTDNARTVKNVNIKTFYKEPSKTDRRFDNDSVNNKAIRICSKNRQALFKKKEAKKEYEEILERLQKNSFDEEHSESKEINPEDVFDEIGYKKFNQRTLGTTITQIAVKKRLEKKQSTRKQLAKNTLSKKILRGIDGNSTQRSAGGFSNVFEERSDPIGITDPEKSNGFSENNRFSDDRNLIIDFNKKPKQTKSGYQLRQKEINNQNFQFAGIAKDKQKLKNTKSNPRFQLLSNIKESILRKDTSGVLSTPFARKKNDNVFNIKSFTGTNFYRKNKHFTVQSTNKFYSTNNTKMNFFKNNNLMTDFDDEANINTSRDKKDNFIPVLPKGIKINGKSHNEYYKRDIKVLKKLDVSCFSENLSRDLDKTESIENTEKAYSDGNLSVQSVNLKSLLSPLLLPDFSRLTEIYRKRKGIKTRRRKRRRVVGKDGIEYSESYSGTTDEEEEKSVVQEKEDSEHKSSESFDWRRSVGAKPFMGAKNITGFLVAKKYPRDIYSLKAAVYFKNVYNSYWMECIENALPSAHIGDIDDVGYYSLLNPFKPKGVNKMDVANLIPEHMDLYEIRWDIKEKIRIDLERDYEKKLIENGLIPEQKKKTSKSKKTTRKSNAHSRTESIEIVLPIKINVAYEPDSPKKIGIEVEQPYLKQYEMENFAAEIGKNIQPLDLLDENNCCERENSDYEVPSSEINENLESQNNSKIVIINEGKPQDDSQEETIPYDDLDEEDYPGDLDWEETIDEIMLVDEMFYCPYCLDSSHVFE